MCGWLRHDGAWAGADALPLTDRAVRYGMSVFETIGIRDGQPLLFDEHALLFAASVRELLGFEAALTLPPLHGDDRGVLRVYATAGDGRPSDPIIAPRFFALFEPSSGVLPPRQTARLHPGASAPFAHGAKTGNYWMQCAAQAAANAKGFDHALLCDHEGRLLSAAMGNVFFVHQGRLCTPPATLGIRPGAMRAWVMTHNAVEEMEFPARQQEETVEVFVTNSRLGVMPLHLGKLQDGPVGRALRDRCRQEKIIP